MARLDASSLHILGGAKVPFARLERSFIRSEPRQDTLTNATNAPRREMSATNDVSLSEDSANSVIDRSSAAASTRVRGVVLLRASLFTQLGVFGASDCGVARVFKPSPTLTDDSMTAPYRYTSCFNFKSLDLEFLVVSFARDRSLYARYSRRPIVRQI